MGMGDAEKQAVVEMPRYRTQAATTATSRSRRRSPLKPVTPSSAEADRAGLLRDLARCDREIAYCATESPADIYTLLGWADWHAERAIILGLVSNNKLS